MGGKMFNDDDDDDDNVVEEVPQTERGVQYGSQPYVVRSSRPPPHLRIATLSLCIKI
jgi:hypothetical protein